MHQEEPMDKKNCNTHCVFHTVIVDRPPTLQHPHFSLQLIAPMISVRTNHLVEASCTLHSDGKSCKGQEHRGDTSLRCNGVRIRFVVRRGGKKLAGPPRMP
jgi:hypothetical protein